MAKVLKQVKFDIFNDENRHFFFLKPTGEHDMNNNYLFMFFVNIEFLARNIFTKVRRMFNIPDNDIPLDMFIYPQETTLSSGLIISEDADGTVVFPMKTNYVEFVAWYADFTTVTRINVDVNNDEKISITATLYEGYKNGYEKTIKNNNLRKNLTN